MTNHFFFLDQAAGHPEWPAGLSNLPIYEP